MTDRPSEQLRALADALVRADNPLTHTSTIHRRVRAIASAVADLEGERNRLREERDFLRELEGQLHVVMDQATEAEMEAADFRTERDALRAAVDRVRARCDGWIEVAEGRCQGWPEPCNCSACDFKEAFIAIRALGEGGDA